LLNSKHSSRFRIPLILALLLFIPLCISACGSKQAGSLAEKTEDPTGRIAANPLAVLTSIEGNVLVQRSGENTWTSGEVGMNLDVKDRIKTEGNSQATLALFEGSVIELNNETEIALVELSSSHTTTNIKIRQELGRTINRVKKLTDAASSYEVETSATVAAVRGTVFWVTVAPDGTTIVTNIEGLVSVTAQGVEVIIPQGKEITIVPGQPPEQPQSTGASVVPALLPTLSPTIPPDTRTAGISVDQNVDPPEAYPGDTVTFTSRVNNTGDIPLSISVRNDRVTAEAVYQSGDINSNSLLDKEESWIYRTQYIVQVSDAGPLTNALQAEGTGAGDRNATASAAATVNVHSIIVKILSLIENQTVARDITVDGTVNDPSITQGVITVNGISSNIPVVNGTFRTNITLADGVNVIVVTVNKPGGISARDTVTLEPVP
jgi:uncharacterized repeat protein (TIGR01451 family)